MASHRAVVADAAALATLLEGYSLDASTELALQDGIASALTDADVAFEREVRLDAGSRPDFMVGGVAVEVKVGGSWAALVRQLHRYAKHERVTELLVVSSRVRLVRVPAELGGKRVAVASVLGAFR